ncbi:MAG: hypothetical protein KAW17_04740 [Candidatus Eisenbacteria sp.]|nr:hypothetical protein [Candidatus Eisenbacteria bacterium]
MGPILIALALAMPVAARADFRDLEIGARPLAVGGAFVSISDDANGVYWNPAGLVWMERPELLGMITRAYGIDDLGLYYLSGAGKVGQFALGGSWMRLGITDVYNEDTFSFAGARGWGKMSFGVTLKFLKVDAPGYEQYDDPGYMGAQMEPTLDVGWQWRPLKSLSFGVAAYNLTRPEINLIDTTTETDPVPRDYRAGFSFVVREVWLLTMDVVKRDTDESSSTLHAGTELWFYDAVALRAGVDRGRITMGAAVDAGRWQIDGVVSAHQMMGNLYRLSLTLRK